MSSSAIFAPHAFHKEEQKMALLTLTMALLAGPWAGSSPDLFDRALGFVPPQAEFIGVIPDLRRANQDLAEMIDAMDRPATVLAGRPIEMLKAQFGVGVGLDEGGSVICWFERGEGEPSEPMPVLLLPTQDAAAFLSGNFSQDEAEGPTAWRTAQGDLVFARSLEGHVLLAPTAELAAAYDAKGGSVARVRDRLGPQATSYAEEADITMWSAGSALSSFAGMASDMSPEFVADQAGDQRLDALTEGATDVLFVVDFDPLGLSLRTFAKYESDSTIGGFLKGGETGRRALDRLPNAPFYLAFSVDVAGMGGLDTFRDLIAILGISEEDLPEVLREDGVQVNQIQMAAYPSRLGIGLGGLLNDSSLVISSSDPDELKEAMRTAVMDRDGERGGIRYDATWTPNKPLRTGGTADAFQVKETVLPRGAGEAPAGAGDEAFQRMFTQLIYGSRGLSGFLGTEGDAVVMTFSQRPDVWNRALAAAGGGGNSLADNQTLQAMRSWLLPSPDIEVLLGVGTFGKLAKQLTRTLPMVQEDMIPDIPEGTPPVAFDVVIGDGLMETATVVPTGVIALVFDQVMEQATRRFNGADTEEDEFGR